MIVHSSLYVYQMVPSCFPMGFSFSRGEWLWEWLLNIRISMIILIIPIPRKTAINSVHPHFYHEQTATWKHMARSDASCRLVKLLLFASPKALGVILGPLFTQLQVVILLPSPVHQENYGKSSSLIANQLSRSAIFNGYVSFPEGTWQVRPPFLGTKALIPAPAAPVQQTAAPVTRPPERARGMSHLHTYLGKLE